MMITASSAPRSIAIIPGVAEDGWLMEKFIRALEENRFSVTNNPRTAAIIFAHSLGCYCIPRDAQASIVLLVGVPCGPNRSLPLDLLRKLKGEAAYHYDRHELAWWGEKLLHGLWCIISGLQINHFLFTGRKNENLPDAAGRRVVIVCPESDAFMAPYKNILPRDKGYEYVTVPGQHDNCWSEPEAYIDLLKSLC